MRFVKINKNTYLNLDNIVSLSTEDYKDGGRISCFDAGDEGNNQFEIYQPYADEILRFCKIPLPTSAATAKEEED